jgi:hypothetical protein
VRIVVRVGTLRSFPRVDDDDPLWMVDYPCIDGQPLGPSGVSEDSNQPTWLPDAVCRLNVDRARLYGMDVDLHRALLSAEASGDRLVRKGQLWNGAGCTTFHSAPENHGPVTIVGSVFMQGHFLLGILTLCQYII